MPMSVDDFINQVTNEVEFLGQAYSHLQGGKEWPFAQAVLQMLFPDLDPDQSFNLLGDPAAGTPVHAAYADEQTGTLYLLAVRYADDPREARTGPGVIYNLLDYVRKLRNQAEPAPAKPHPVPTPVERAASAIREGYNVTAVLALWGMLDQDVDVAEQRRRYGMSDQEFLVYDLSDLRRFAAGMEREPDHTSTEVTLLDHAVHQGPVEALFGSVSADEWRSALEPLGEEIYDVNVRTPLGLRSKVNKQMRDTIQSPDDSLFFWYYNNGITVLCRGFSEVLGAANRFKIVSPRIVNGGQTTQAIIDGAGAGGGAAVIVRFIAALPESTQVSAELAGNRERLQDLYLNIAKFTNSQNPIELPDFRSNEVVQQRLHEDLRELGWFYEHRRGQWENEADKAQFRNAGGYQKFTMVELAQEWFAFAGHPSTAIRARLSLFEEQGPYSSIFLRSRSAEEYLIAHLLFQQMQERVKEQIKKAKIEADRAGELGAQLSKDARNYLAVGRATKLAVAHLAALLGRVFTRHYGQFNADAARAVLGSVEDGTLVEGVYSELEDTLFHAIAEISGDKYRTFHQYLSDPKSLERLDEHFEWLLQREQRKGRSPLDLPMLPGRPAAAPA